MDVDSSSDENWNEMVGRWPAVAAAGKLILGDWQAQGQAGKVCSIGYGLSMQHSKRWFCMHLLEVPYFLRD
jgi:hypothetical protein